MTYTHKNQNLNLSISNLTMNLYGGQFYEIEVFNGDCWELFYRCINKPEWAQEACRDAIGQFGIENVFRNF